MSDPMTFAALLQHLQTTYPSSLPFTPAEHEHLTNVSQRIAQVRDASLPQDYAELLAEVEEVGVQGWIHAVLDRQRAQILRGHDDALGDLAERLERLARDLEEELNLRADDDLEELSSSDTGEYNDFSDSPPNTSRGSKSKLEKRRRIFTTSSVAVEMGSSGVHSPTTSTGGTTLAHDAEYPPPLAPTHHGIEDGDEAETRHARRLAAETASWKHEQKELQTSLSPPWQVADCTAECTASPLMSPYLYIPLPAEFTLPQHGAHLHPLTFREPPAAVHFPYGARKADLLAVLYHRYVSGLPVLLPLNGINVMQVRTHQMESELKNAVQEVIGKEQWDGGISEKWYTEGRGDTYIISRGEVVFHGVSGTAGRVGDGEDSKEIGRGISEFDNCSTAESVTQSHLRGGGGDDLSSYEDMERRSYAALRSGTGRFAVSADYRDVSSNVQCGSSPGFQQAIIEHARILQLQNAAQNRSIERLQEIVTDVEGTVVWQDEKLDAMQRGMEHCEAETAAARQEAANLEVEVQELKEILGQINAQVGSFSVELDQRLAELGLSGEASIRGGDGETEDEGSSSSWETISETEKADDTDIQATAFYFFPSTSIMILLTQPVRYLHWPRNTTLKHAYALLQSNRDKGLETNPYLRHTREILEIREELGIPLPDTSDRRQILVSLPDVEEKVSERESHRDCHWDRTFGPDAYETMLKEQVAAADVSTQEYHDSTSTLAGKENSDFWDPSSLINAVDHAFRTVRTPLDACSICGDKRPPTPEPYMDTGMQNPYASPDTSVRGGDRDSSLSPPPTSMPPSILYPSVIKESRAQRHTRPIVPEDTRVPHPARMPEERIWNVVRYPHDEQSDKPYATSELERSANYDFELGMCRQNSSIRQSLDTFHQAVDTQGSGGRLAEAKSPLPALLPRGHQVMNSMGSWDEVMGLEFKLAWLHAELRKAEAELGSMFGGVPGEREQNDESE